MARLVNLMEENLQCYFCNRKTNTGILLLNQYMCRDCEKVLIETPNDELKYEINKRKIQKLWRELPQGVL